MTTYNFKTTNVFLVFLRFLFAAIVTLTVFTFIALNRCIILSNKLWYTVGFLVIFFTVYFVTKRIIVINTQVTFIDRNEIKLELNHFLFGIKKSSFLIPEIKNYLHHYGNGYKVFYLNTRKGSSLRFLIFTEVENLKSFNDFFENLTKNIEKYNKENALNLIVEKPTIYQSKLGLFYGIILVIILISIPISYLIFETKINFGIILILYPTGILFLWRLYYGQKKININ